MKYFLYFLFSTIVACFSINKKQNEVYDKEKNTSDFYDEQSSALSKTKLNDSIIWNGENTKLYVLHERIEDGEEQIIIYNENKDTLLSFHHDDGGSLTFPFVIKIKDELFVNFFEVWEGSGFLSKKRFYHFNNQKKVLEKVKILDQSSVLKKFKNKFSIKDSIYTKKGEFYKEFSFDKSCFTKNGELPFTLIIFNQSKPNLNNGLEGYRKFRGVYKFKEQEGVYFAVPDELLIID